LRKFPLRLASPDFLFFHENLCFPPVFGFKFPPSPRFEPQGHLFPPCFPTLLPLALAFRLSFRSFFFGCSPPGATDSRRNFLLPSFFTYLTGEISPYKSPVRIVPTPVRNFIYVVTPLFREGWAPESSLVPPILFIGVGTPPPPPFFANGFASGRPSADGLGVPGFFPAFFTPLAYPYYPFLPASRLKHTVDVDLGPIRKRPLLLFFI